MQKEKKKKKKHTHTHTQKLQKLLYIKFNRNANIFLKRLHIFKYTILKRKLKSLYLKVHWYDADLKICKYLRLFIKITC